MALTYKQRAFVEHFLGDAQWNATEAASLAGYKGNRNTLSSVGYENLTKPEIQEHIRRRLQEMGASAEELVWRWLTRIRADISPFVTKDGLDVQALKDAGLGHLIKGVRKTQHATNIELRDPDLAEDRLARCFGMFVDRREVSGIGGKPIEHKDVSDISDAEAGRRMVALLELGGAKALGACLAEEQRLQEDAPD